MSALDLQRKRAARTAVILALIAAGFYLAFILTYLWS